MESIEEATGKSSHVIVDEDQTQPPNDSLDKPSLEQTPAVTTKTTETEQQQQQQHQPMESIESSSSQPAITSTFDMDHESIQSSLPTASAAAANVPTIVLSSQNSQDLPRLHNTRSRAVPSASKPTEEAPSQVLLVYNPTGTDPVTITSRDLQSLEPLEYLNDTIIWFYLK
jgi:Ulp1 family protease